jgi:hypothetical protein
MAFTMACPNFKKGLKMAFSPLGVKNVMFFKTRDEEGKLLYLVLLINRYQIKLVSHYIRHT